MTPATAAADRLHEVRKAARGWRRAGAIDDAALAAIDSLYPDDRVRVGPVLRVLLFLFTAVAVIASLALVFQLLDHSDDAADVVLTVFGAMLVILTDLQIQRWRRAQGGIEAATSFFAIAYLAAGAAVFLLGRLDWEESPTLSSVLLLLALLCALAAWRWGYPLYAAFGAASLFAVLARLPAGRWACVLTALLALPFLFRGMEDPRLPPSLRRCAAAALAVALLAVYLVLQIYGYDHRFLEDWGRFFGGPAAVDIGRGQLARAACIAGTALIPPLLIAWGIRTRRRLLLVLGILLGAVSIVTLRAYVYVGPVWAILTVSGALVLAAAASIRRLLDRGPDQARAGFTAEPLFERLDRQQVLEQVASAALVLPQHSSADQDPAFRGGGGASGGGGATESF